MPARNDQLQRVLIHPLTYLHPHHLQVPSSMDTPQTRDLLDDIVLQGLGLSDGLADVERSPVTDLWLEYWDLLPTVARLIGTQAAWPHLARGAAIRKLSRSVRAFGSCSIAPRLAEFEALEDGELLVEQLDAVGLNALLAWRGRVALALLERLPLQFSPQVIARQQLLAPTTPDAALLALAIQHARIHSQFD